MARHNWSLDETLVAFNVYCRTAFGRLHSRNPEIIRVADALGRSPGALAMKCCNIASFDPALQARGISGLRKASRLDREVWEAFETDPETVGFDSERAFATATRQRLRTAPKIEWEDIQGLDRTAVTKVRVNQRLFRSIVLSGYDGRCAVCRIPVARLLVAAHIVPWSKDSTHRMNPRNGICLCSIHDKAFDSGLLLIDEQYLVSFASSIQKLHDDEAVGIFFLRYEGARIHLPDRWQPDPRLLKKHCEFV